MLPFELLAFIVLIAIIILEILFIKMEPPGKPSAEEKLSFGERKAPKNSLNCPYGFGYLKKREKKTPITDECLSCPRMLECLSSSK